MIKLSDAAKQEYAKYVGADGKLRIDDTVPENLREIFQYFNDRGINILKMEIDDNVEVLDEPDSNIDEVSSELDDDNYDDEMSSQEATNFKENEDVSLDDLENMFN